MRYANKKCKKCKDVIICEEDNMVEDEKGNNFYLCDNCIGYHCCTYCGVYGPFKKLVYVEHKDEDVCVTCADKHFIFPMILNILAEIWS